ncbi:hypothetical protein [Nesterenkonia sp. K-15-9-6]|uniref:hypothetical protein n=1 Tax=Nesterenkonia sp. K-15-9-6 TaxID=3093918 RepID=UPI004044E42F
MRHLLSTLCALLAALLAAAALAGGQLDQLLREEEPVREIAGDLPAQEPFGEAVVGLLVEELTGQDVEALPSGVRDTVSGFAGSLLQEDRTLQAWDETLQTTREGVDAELARLFHDGGTGSPQDLDITLDLSPVAAAVTEPLRDGLDGMLGWLPFLDESSFDALAPEVVIDLDALAEDGVDPYPWATAAEAARHWPVIAGAAVVVGALALLIGAGRGRWAALALAGLVAVVAGIWMASTVASPDMTPHQPVPEAVAVLLDHVEGRFTDWAQPAWWVFSAAGGVAVVIGLLGAATSGARGRRSVGHDPLHRV